MRDKSLEPHCEICRCYICKDLNEWPADFLDKCQCGNCKIKRCLEKIDVERERIELMKIDRDKFLAELEDLKNPMRLFIEIERLDNRISDIERWLQCQFDDLNKRISIVDQYTSKIIKLEAEEKVDKSQLKKVKKKVKKKSK